MTRARRKSLIIRWSLVAMALVAVFWGIWSLFAPVPEVTELVLSKKAGSVFTLPFAVSRWWDILFAGAWTSGIVWTVTHPKIQDDDDMLGSMVFCLVFGLVFSLVGGLAFSLVFGLVIGLVIGAEAILSMSFWRRVGSVFTNAWSWLMAEKATDVIIEVRPNMTTRAHDKIVKDLADLDKADAKNAKRRQELLARKKALEEPGSETAKALALGTERMV